MDKQLDVVIRSGQTYGVLTILDCGEEWALTDGYLEKVNIINGLKSEISKFDGFDDKDLTIRQRRELYALRKQLASCEAYVEPHYKCRCKCGKVHYYNRRTLLSKPKFCFYPVAISTRHTYSIKARNATYRKWQKYAGLEHVVLCDKEKCDSDDEAYCTLYVAYRLKQKEKKDRDLANLRASYAHEVSKSYDVVPSVVHDTLECVQRLDDVEKLHTCISRGKETSGRYVKYARYEYRCHLCGKTFRFLDCDIDAKLRVHPPEAYGYRAYNGYWSDGHCDCHEISSFQWTVIDILEKNMVKYRSEVSLPGLVGDFGKPLRFDICVFFDDGSYCLIELQGEQHYESVDAFGGERGFEKQRRYDTKKREFCDINNIRLLEIKRVSRHLYSYCENILRQEGII